MKPGAAPGRGGCSISTAPRRSVTTTRPPAGSCALARAPLALSRSSAANATLVTSGPYRLIRHPMYSAALILTFAAALFAANVIVFVGGILMFTLLAARSQVEERRLVEKFGDAYRAYQSRTGRFLPLPPRR